MQATAHTTALTTDPTPTCSEADRKGLTEAKAATENASNAVIAFVEAATNEAEVAAQVLTTAASTLLQVSKDLQNKELELIKQLHTAQHHSKTMKLILH